MVAFNDIPTSIRIPFIGVEFDSSRASQGPVLQAYVGLLMGQSLAAGTGTANTLYRVTNVEEVIALAGRGSMLHRQAVGWFAINTSTELWIMILDDDGAAVANVRTITFATTAGVATATTIYLYIGGQRVAVAIAAGDEDTDIAATAEAALDLALDTPYTYAVAAAVVTATAVNKGEVRNTFDMRDSYRDGEGLPPELSIAYAQSVAGTTNPVLTTAIAALGDTWLNIWGHAYTDATSLSAIEAEMDRRFGPTTMIDGVAFTAAGGTFSVLTTLGETRNNKSSSIVGQPGINPLTPPDEFAAETAGIAARYGTADPARPFQTLQYVNALPPATGDLFTDTERGIESGLLYSGISATRVRAGKVQVDRLITTYQENVAGAPDTAYLDVNTLLTLSYLRFSFRTLIATKFPRHKLADDDPDARFGPGQYIMTPLLGQSVALGWFRDMQSLGLVEGFAQFKADLEVVRNADPNRLDWLLNPDLLNQLIVNAAQIRFLL